MKLFSSNDHSLSPSSITSGLGSLVLQTCIGCFQVFYGFAAVAGEFERADHDPVEHDEPTGRQSEANTPPSVVGRTFDRLGPYEEVRVLGLDPDGVRIMHATGVAKVPIESLSAELRNELGLSTDVAMKHREEVAGQKRVQQLIAEAQTWMTSQAGVIDGSIFQIVPGEGILMHNPRYTDGSKRRVEVQRQVQVDGPTTMSPKRSRSFETHTSYRWVQNSERLDGYIFVVCDTSNLVDGSPFTEAVWQHGTYSYKNVFGAIRTVQQFTTDGAGLAIRRFELTDERLIQAMREAAAEVELIEDGGAGLQAVE